jgi:hypothetical protein
MLYYTRNDIQGNTEFNLTFTPDAHWSFDTDGSSGLIPVLARTIAKRLITQ